MGLDRDRRAGGSPEVASRPGSRGAGHRRPNPSLTTGCPGERHRPATGSPGSSEAPVSSATARRGPSRGGPGPRGCAARDADTCRKNSGSGPGTGAHISPPGVGSVPAGSGQVEPRTEQPTVRGTTTPLRWAGPGAGPAHRPAQPPGPRPHVGVVAGRPLAPPAAAAAIGDRVSAGHPAPPALDRLATAVLSPVADILDVAAEVFAALAAVTVAALSTAPRRPWTQDAPDRPQGWGPAQRPSLDPVRRA